MYVYPSAASPVEIIASAVQEKTSTNKLTHLDLNEEEVDKC